MKMFFVTLASASLFQFVFAQTAPTVLTVTAPSGISAKAGETTKATLSVTVASGYHANSNKPVDAYLIPLRLTWNPGGPLTAASVVFPKPQTQKLGFSAKPVSVFTGNFDIVTQFKVASDAVPGTSTATGKLHYQACDDRSCLPPATIEVSVPVAIGK
jgi:DsbC/DsbD-like thiol-disulfide interchange protein